MTFLDLFLGGILAYGGIRGLWKGLFVEMASFVSLLIGIYIAMKFSYLMRSIIEGHVSWNPKTIEITAFALTFIGVVTGIFLLAKLFTTIADFASLGIINRLAGGLFGLLKMTLILSILLSLFLKINYNEMLLSREKQEQSLFFNPVQKVASFIFPMIKEWFPENLIPTKSER